MPELRGTCSVCGTRRNVLHMDSVWIDVLTFPRLVFTCRDHSEERKNMRNRKELIQGVAEKSGETQEAVTRVIETLERDNGYLLRWLVHQNRDIMARAW